MIVLTIGLSVPHRILAIEGEIEQALGFRPHNVLDHSLALLLTKSSDWILLEKAIYLSQSNTSTRLEISLHDRIGRQKRVVIRCDLYTNGSCIDACKVKITDSTAITLQQACEPSAIPKAIVSLDPPYRIQYANDALTKRFPMTEGIIGRSVGILSADVLSMIDGAADGIIATEHCAHGVIPENSTAKASEFVFCTPVSNGSNGWIQNILVQILPNLNSAVPPSPRSQASDAESTLHRDNSATAHPGTVGTCSHAETTMELDGAASASRSAVRVVLTHDLLRALRGQPLPLAARAVGVSATSFKRACRRLGVGRWEYTRGPARALRRASEARALTADSERRDGGSDPLAAGGGGGGGGGTAQREPGNRSARRPTAERRSGAPAPGRPAEPLRAVPPPTSESAGGSCAAGRGRDARGPGGLPDTTVAAAAAAAAAVPDMAGNARRG